MGSILDRRTKIPHAAQHGQKEKEKHKKENSSILGALWIFLPQALGAGLDMGSVPRTTWRFLLNTSCQGPLLTSLPSTVKHTLLLVPLFPTFVSSLSLPGSACRGQSPLEEDGGIYHMLENAPAQISQATQLDLETQCQDTFQNLGAGWWQGWELAKGECCQMKNEAEEVQGAVQVDCLSEIPQQQHNTAAKCPDLQHLQFPWYKYSSRSTWPISRYQWFSASPQKSWLLAIGPLELTGATTTGLVPKPVDLALLKALHQEFCNEKDARSKMNGTPKNEIQTHFSMPWKRENRAPSWEWWEKSVKHRN